MGRGSVEHFLSRSKLRYAAALVPRSRHIPSPGELLRQGLWQTTDEQVLKARWQLRRHLASEASSPQDITDAAVTCFGGISAKLLESARALLLLSRNRPDASDQARQLREQLHSRLVAARKSILKDITAGLTKRVAKRQRQNTHSELDSQIENIMREFDQIGPDLEHIEFVPTKRQRTRAVNRQVEILFLAADPRRAASGTPTPTNRLLELDEEYRAIQQRIRQGSHRDDIELQAHLAVRPQDLLDALNQHRPRIVHFSGHGTASEGIVLLTSDGRPEPVGSEFLVNIFSTLTSSTSLVVLNACYSKKQADAISQVVGITIGTESTIADEDAIAFSSAFYGALANNLSVDAAFEQADAVLTGVRRRERPILLTRPGLDPSLLQLIKVPDSTSYEPLGRTLSEAVNSFLTKRQRHSTALSTAAQYLDRAPAEGTQHGLSHELRDQIEAVVDRLPHVVAQIVEEASDFVEDLDGVSRRWAGHLSVEAVSKLTQLEEVASSHKRALDRLSRSLLRIDGRRILARAPELLADYARTVRELLILAETSWNRTMVSYNQLLEFLPGGLLERDIVRYLRVKL